MAMPDRKRKRAPAAVARLVRVRLGEKRSEGPAVYMVLAHGAEEDKPTYSIVEVTAGATVSRLVHTYAGSMSFVAVGKQIVGVGEDKTSVYDPKTSTEIRVYSKQGKEGTCAFDLDAEKQWEMVHDKNLPFTGQAVPLGHHRFVASKADGGEPAVYYIEVFHPDVTGTGKKELSIVELQVASNRLVPGHLLCAMGKGSFSSSPEKLYRARIVHRTYSHKPEDQDPQVYKLLDPHAFLPHPCWPVAVLTM
uniref:Uncharacterized protein n=1 Tax=Leersia perrieri TaxID=77586 RepID=A0A0D9WKJ0_9ORYZ